MSEKATSRTINRLQMEIEELRTRLSEAEDTLTAIRSGEVDAIVVSGAEGERVYSLTSAETPYRVIIEEMNEGAVTISIEGIILFSNRRFAELVHEPVERVIGSSFQRFVSAEDSAAFESLLTQGRTTRSDGVILSSIGTKDHPLFLFVSLSPLPSDLPGDLCIMAADVSELKKKERELIEMHESLEQRVAKRTSELAQTIEKLHASRRAVQKMVEDAFNAKNELEAANAKLREEIDERRKAEEALALQHIAVQSAANAIVITDRTGTIISVNHAFTQMTGYTAEEAIGKNPSIIKSGRQSPAFYQRLWETITAGRVWTGEIENRRKDGSYYTEEMTITPVRQAGGEISHFISIKQDITERKMLEHQLLQSQKLEGIGTLAGGISHDFNNILSAIMGNASLLESHPDNPEKVKQRAAKILKSTERGSQVVKQLMTVAHKTNLQRTTVDANEVVREISKLLEEMLPKTIEVSLDLHRDLPYISADPNQLHQVLLNLLFNARDAMPSGGNITISTIAVSGAELQKKFASAAAEPYVGISVRDTGAGMDEATRLKIFDPFFTTKDIGKGTGLGLPVALGIIERHHGFIDVVSEPGGGSVFTFYMPLAEDGQLFIEMADPQMDTIPGGSETLLVIEDEDQIRDIAVELLVKKGYTVITAVQGEEGVDLFSRHKAEISLVLSDLGLPKINGEELYHRIREMSRDVSFILLTGFIEPAKQTELLTMGVRDIIHKPYKPVEILQKVRAALDAAKHPSGAPPTRL